MSKRVTILGLVVLALLVVGLVISAVPKARLKASMKGSENNLRSLALFAAQHSDPDPMRDASRLPLQIPAGTLMLAGVPPDERLSWILDVLPGFDQTKQNSEAVLAAIDRAKPWTAAPNQSAGRTRLPVLLCPQNTPRVPPDGPGITCYVGISGVGADAAEWPHTWVFSAPRAGGTWYDVFANSQPELLVFSGAGAFWYDGPTPFDDITDGLSQTLLFGETRADVGPWLRGGHSTIRGLNDSPDAPPLIGEQFGGYFAAGAYFAMCDGSVRMFSVQTDPHVLLSMATIAGRQTDPIPGE
jgi:hypothetical protein